jgi:hypothetical protein
MASNIERDEWKPFYVQGAASAPATPASGDPVRLGVFTGIALTDEGEDIAAVTSIYTGPFWARMAVHANSGAIADGSPLYFNDTATGTPATNLSNSPTGVFFGYAKDAVTSTEVDTILVDHPVSAGSAVGGNVGGYRVVGSNAALALAATDGVILLTASTANDKAATMTATYPGHVVTLRLVAASGGSYTLAVTGGNVTLNAANESAIIAYSGAAWELVALMGATLV